MAVYKLGYEPLARMVKAILGANGFVFMVRV
jgi:hypothetical protein